MDAKPDPSSHEHSVLHAEREMLEIASSNDYTTGIVPQEKRRTRLTMTLLWLSLMASVSLMYAGYLARSQGLSLTDMIVAGIIASLAIGAYGYGATNLGNYSGQTHTLLTRAIYGRFGSPFVSFLLILMGIGWYGFQAYFLALITQGLFGWNNVTLVSVIFAVVMVFNDLFGFLVAASYARFIPAPLLLAWGLWALAKGVVTVPSGTLFSTPAGPATTTVMVIVGLLVGSASWGNEPDIFRYAKPKIWENNPAIVIGYPVGVLVFPIAGYLMAMLSNSADFGTIIKYFVDFSLFGLTGLAVVVFFVNQFALNDGNLYEAVNAMQNIFGSIRGWRRIYSVLALGLIGAVVAAEMTSLQNNFFIVAGISGIFVPTATTIMFTDYFVVPRLFGIRRPTETVTPWSATASINYIGLGALVIALVVGAYTGGLIPGISGFGTTNIGFPTLQSWIIGAGLYLLGILAFQKSPSLHVLLGYPKTYQAKAPESKVAAAAAGR